MTYSSSGNVVVLTSSTSNIVFVVHSLEDQKTDQQKLREQQLLKELLELMDEREWLDQRLTNTTKYVVIT